MFFGAIGVPPARSAGTCRDDFLVLALYIHSVHIPDFLVIPRPEPQPSRRVPMPWSVGDPRPRIEQKI